MKRAPGSGPLARALEMAVALAALVTSVTSIGLSLSQGDDMARLVQAQSWPYLEYESSNTGDRGPEIDIAVRNSGVGPAKVESFAVLWDGKPVAGWAALIHACCIPDGTPAQASLEMPKLTDNRMISSKLIQRVLRASDSVVLLHLPKTDANAALWRSSTARASGSSFASAIARCSTSAGRATCARLNSRS
ncbi:MAG: hypothetical protein ABW186_10410 [Rhodanobacteraceae bacterium]